MLLSHFSEKILFECGCDEAGRGALAGPLFAAAVILPHDFQHADLNDSKQLSRKKRELLRTEIEAQAISFSVVAISEETIDDINILNATFLAMNRAISQLTTPPDLLLIDGNRFQSETTIPYHCIVKGDAKFASIAAASILAKTYRDDWMRKIALEYPVYGWDKNMGYATIFHQQAMLTHGLSDYHRKSFHLKRQLRLDL